MAFLLSPRLKFLPKHALTIAEKGIGWAGVNFSQRNSIQNFAVGALLR